MVFFLLLLGSFGVKKYSRISSPLLGEEKRECFLVSLGRAYRHEKSFKAVGVLYHYRFTFLAKRESDETPAPHDRFDKVP
jgi:hypothetical protein